MSSPRHRASLNLHARAVKIRNGLFFCESCSSRALVGFIGVLVLSAIDARRNNGEDLIPSIVHRAASDVLDLESTAHAPRQMITASWALDAIACGGVCHVRQSQILSLRPLHSCLHACPL